MNNSGSFFTVKNAGIFLLLSSFFLSFTDPKPHFHSIKHLENFFAEAKEKSWISGFRRADRKSSIEVPFNIVHGSADRTLLSSEGTSSEVYNSAERQEGVIGTENFVAMSDDPADNIFTVNLPKYDRSKRYILAYSARGVNSASSVTRSINQSYSLGGYISSRGNTWVAIEEEIDPHILRGGTNRILFNTASVADYYAVKDVRIIESGTKRSSFYTLTSTVIAEDKVYLKGFINTTASVKNIEIAGREVALTGNEFEYYSSSNTDKTSFNLKFTKFDGTVVNEQIRAFETGGKAGNVVFSKPEENIIYKDKTGALLGLRRIDLPPVESSITNISQSYSGYRYKRNTDGETPVHLPYDPAMIPKGSKETEISTFKFDYEKKKWTRIVIDSINTEERFVVVTADNDAGGADYINGIIKNPESPETSSFTPTTTNDVPVANPGAKINMISQPVANQQGSANVSYPIEIPAGINGFQPNISIDYNSDSKTGGWAGLGWDVPMETIDIDTRWGVPEFNSSSESEIYTINGEQLVFDDSYLPNKFPVQESRAPDRIFYFRTGVKERTKIVRNGSGTQNYTWEITGDDGTVKKYTETLTDDSGNVVKWFLKTVTDVYGNVITYNYNEPIYNLGKNKYLSRIDYSNNTSVEFTNLSVGNTADREDVTSSYKSGTKISEFKILDKISVKRAGIIIREYKFEYKTGDFGKKLLTDIIQKKGSEEFNRHKFDYTKTGISNDGLLFSKDPKVITSPADNLTSGNFDKANMSLISGTQGKSENWKGALTFGVGLGASGNKKRTGGVNYTYAENENFGKSQLMDIDGDGLPDKVFFSGTGSIKYRRNTGNSFSSNLSAVVGLSNIPLSKNSSYVNSFGVELSLKYIQGGVTFSTTKGNTPVYFSDINGDGLPDLLYYGLPYFNKIRSNNGNPTNYFSNVEFDSIALTDTPNAILKGINAPSTEIPEEESNLLANIVKVWEAPNTGVIDISNIISLEQNSTDGVDIWMELGTLTRTNESNTNLSAASSLGSKITLNSQGQSQNLNATNIAVSKGQRIYIIASSKKNPKGDKIKIESNVNYLSAAGFVSSNMNIKDANEDYFFKFNSKNSYLKNSTKGNGVSEKGKAKITWPNLSSVTFSDDLNFKIYKLERKISDTTDFGMSDSPTLIFHQKLRRGESLGNLASDQNLIANIDIQNLQLNSTSTEANPTLTFLYLEVSADTNVAWDKINWSPMVSVSTAEGDIKYSMAVQYKTFSEKVRVQSVPTTTDFGLRANDRWYPKFTGCYDQNLTIPLQDIDGTQVTFSIKFTNYTTDHITYQPTFILKKKVKIVGNIMEIPYIENYHVNNPGFSQALFEIHVDNYQVAKYLSQLNPNIEKIANNCFREESSVKANYYSTRSETQKYNSTTGSMWQGWGEFSYNGTDGKPLDENRFASTPVAEENFPLPDCGEPGTATYESCMLDYINQQQNSRYFTPLSYSPDNESYNSPMESALLNGNYMQPYNLRGRKPSETFEGNPSFVTANPSGIITHSKGNSLNIYGGAGPFNISGGFSRDESSEHFQDFNGDQYPDVIVGNKYYKTNMSGGLTNPITISDKTIRNNSKNTNIGGSITKSINPEKNSNTQTSGANSWGELYSQMGSSFSAAGASVGATLGNSESKNNNIWFDINGDGLVDYVSEGQVFINNGKNFVNEPGWNVGSEVFKNQTEAVSGGGGVNLGNGSWVLGIGKNFSYSHNKVFFIDVTGDGLVDKLVRDGSLYNLYVNTGERICANPVTLGNIDFEIENNQNSSGLNVYGTACVAFGLKVCLSLGYGNDKSTNKQTVDLRDFNGDGVPDILMSSTDTQMTVIENQAAKFNLLNSITNPLGGTIGLFYDDKNIGSGMSIGNSYQMPFNKQVLVRLKSNIDLSLTDFSENRSSSASSLVNLTFEYENGIQDRRERQFLGFGKVKTIDMTGRTQVTEYETNFAGTEDFYVPYDNSKVRKYFYKKGLVRSTYTTDSLGRERQRTDFIYRYFDQTAENYILTENQGEPTFKDIGRIIPFLYKTQSVSTEFFGTNSHSKITTTTVNEYDMYGNVTKYTDLGGDTADTSDDIKFSVAYHPATSQNVVGIPQQHVVSNSANTVLRKSETSINSKGDVTSIRRFIGSDFAEYNYEYDTYGNLKKSIFPKNVGQSEADRMYYKYDYDSAYNTYITKISDARGLSSTTSYDTNYLFGVPKTTTDTNNAVAYYTYDSFGRLTEYRAPIATSWTVKLKYYKDGDLNSRVAITEKNAPVVNGISPPLNYFSSLFVNEWGEELATKKLYGGTNENYIYTYSIAPVKDIKGRVVKSFVNRLAVAEPGSIENVLRKFNINFNQSLNGAEFKNYYISYKYDELDRPVKAIQNGVTTNTGTANLTTETQYGFGADRNGNIQFSAKTISPKGIESSVYTDEKGRTTATSQQGDNKTLWTSYTYDLLGQLTEVKDQNSNKTQYGYDQRGRRITETHPDAGTSNYQYDLNNNLISMDNPVLRALNQSIGYTYQFNRLTGINYPDYQVTYEYGGVNAADFGAGRLIKLTDHTGIQMFKYSKLGQITENKRFMVAPNVRAKVFKTNFVYDVYDRINKITYPDSEEVYYNYSPFGMLDNIQSKPAGTAVQTPIVYDILYDYNEQTKEVKAGNGTRTIYEYDPWGRLQQLALSVSSGDIRRNSYTFDKDANISSIISHPVNPVVSNGISVATEKSFEYDGFNRLKKSVIKATGTTDRKYYQLDMAYTDMHAIANKDSRWKEYDLSSCLNPSAMGDKMVYHYEDRAHPNAVSSIELKSPNSGGSLFKTPWDCGTGHDFIAPLIKENYTYDANGNMTKVMSQDGDDSGELGTDPRKNVKRQLFWDAQNRLKGISEGTALHHYVYDEDGQRALKSEGASRTIKIDGNPSTRPLPTVMGPYNYYPNGYMVASDRQISKHYYIGSNKVAARVSDTPSHLFLSQASGELQGVAAGLQTEAEDMAATAGLPPIQWENFVIDDGGISLETEQMCSDEVLAQADAFSQARNTGCYKKIMQGYYTALQNNTVCAFWHSFKLDNCMIDQPVEEQPYQTYWVHPDHLGSGSVITNQAGNTTNWYEYMPFGEMLMEQSNYEYNNLYKYNGKELDEATGLYYYGARYMDPKTSVWLSVDPLAEKYPNISPYVYVANNPMLYVDPDGRDIVPWFVNTIKYRGDRPGNYNRAGHNFKLFATKNYVSPTMDLALKKLVTSQKARDFLLQYMKKGQSFYGIIARESGKLSDKDLNIYDIRNDNKNNITRRNVMGAHGHIANGKTNFNESNGNLDIYIDTVLKGTSDKDVNSVVETTAHEIGQHGTKHGRYLKLLESGKTAELDRARSLDYNTDHSESENTEGAKVYNGIMNDLKMKPIWDKSKK